MESIAIIIQKLRGGGAERAAANLSLILSERFDVHLFVFDGRDIAYPYGGTLHDLKMPPKNGKIGKFLNMIRRSIVIREQKKRLNIVGSISLMDGANMVNILSHQGENVFTSVRNYLSRSAKKTKSGRIRTSERLQMRFIARHSAKIVAVAKGVEDDLVANFAVPSDKVTTICNLCDGELLRETAQIHAEDARSMTGHTVTTMGRLNRQKAQWHLLRAFKSVIRDIPDAKLYILGEGELGYKLKKLTKDLDIEANVVFMGFVEAPHAYIMNSDLFVLPSNYEGMSNVLLEAIACGCPTVATDCHSGSREILAPDTAVKERLDAVEYAPYGILTSVCGPGQFNADEPLTREEEQLAEAITRVLNDGKLRETYAKKALERSEDFTPEHIRDMWIALLHGNQG